MDSSISPIVERLHRGALNPLKQAFVGKDVVVDLMGVCLVAGENLFILGPPGTAKSALVHELGKRIEGQTFEYLLTRFTEPNELFGPFDIRKLRDGVLETNTDGMLPEASLIFLDELLNANSAILNSLLTVLNERVLRRGRETLELPVLMTVGASNHLPEEEALGALFDRFLLRVRSDNVGDSELDQVLEAGWALERQNGSASSEPLISLQELQQVRALLSEVDLSPLRQISIELIVRLRRMGIPISDRRAVKLQRLVAASALLCQRMTAHISDLWVLEHIWDLEEQRELLRAAVREVMEASADEETRIHPRARSADTPDPESLNQEIEDILAQAEQIDSEGDSIPSHLKDRLSAIESRSQWVSGTEQRQFLDQRIAGAWARLNATPDPVEG